MDRIPEFKSNDSESAKADESQGSQRRSRRAKIPTREEIHEQLVFLNSAVAMRFITTAQASVIQRGLNMLLNESNRNPNDGAGAASLEQLTTLYRQHPDLLSAIEPFLTDAHIEIITRQSDEPEK